MLERPRRPRYRSLEIWTLIAFVVGLALSLAMVTRSQVRGDQLNLLARGWLFAFQGEWVPFGNPLSGGGKVPGGLTGLLVGLPLKIWSHHRTAVIPVFLSHLLAYFLLDGVVRRELGPEARLVFAVLYWLNPWRLYYSGFLWNPGYLFVVAAAQTWTQLRSRSEPVLWSSALHAVALGFGVQLHPSVLILIVASALLWWRGYYRLHPGGLLVGVALVGASLLPWLRVVLAAGGAPAAAPDLVEVLMRIPYSVLRAVLYWLRFPSLLVARSIRCFDFTVLAGESGATIGRMLGVIVTVVGFLTLAVSLWANRRLWRGASLSLSRGGEGLRGADWLAGTARWHLVALAVVAAVSPITLLGFHLLSVHHMAVLTVVLAIGPLLQGSRRRTLSKALAAGCASNVLLGMLMLAGSPMYRCGGRNCGKGGTPPRLRGHHPMLDELRILDTCHFSSDEAQGEWWIDVFPDPKSVSPRGIRESPADHGSGLPAAPPELECKETAWMATGSSLSVSKRRRWRSTPRAVESWRRSRRRGQPLPNLPRFAVSR